MSPSKRSIPCPRCQSDLQFTTVTAMTFCPTCLNYLDNIMAEDAGLPYPDGRLLAMRHIATWVSEDLRRKKAAAGQGVRP